MRFSKILGDVPEIASAHHERLDGKGYPQGLEADEIPMEAKILAICDVYDALTAWDRPYKPAMPLEKVLSILREEKGAMFDPDLVDLFIEKRLFEA